MFILKNIKLAELSPNNGQVPGLPKNPRFIRDTRFEALKKSIEDAPEMLALRELIVYEYQGKYIIIAGNMRYRAMKDLGFGDAPCKVLDKDTPVEKLREYTIKDNQAFGADDWECLANEWDAEELSSWGMETPDTWGADEGNDGEDETASGENTQIEVEDDDFDEDSEPIPTRCSPGDIFALGSHRLICGDSTSPETLSALMDGELADLYLTDPPYNVDYTGKEKALVDYGRKNNRISQGEHVGIKNDCMSDNDFKAFLIKVFKNAHELIKPGAVFYIWHANTQCLNFFSACLEIGWKIRECLIWVKNRFVMGRQDYQWQHEPCLYGWKDGAAHKWYNNRSQTTTLNFSLPSRSDLHPTMKPVPLFAYQIQNSSKEGDLVLDSFGGRGTTLIACEQLNRNARLVELSPAYCDVILARWEKLTGQKAEKLRNINENKEEVV